MCEIGQIYSRGINLLAIFDGFESPQRQSEVSRTASSLVLPNRSSNIPVSNSGIHPSSLLLPHFSFSSCTYADISASASQNSFSVTSSFAHWNSSSYTSKLSGCDSAGTFSLFAWRQYWRCLRPDGSTHVQDWRCQGLFHRIGHLIFWRFQNHILIGCWRIGISTGILSLVSHISSGYRVY